MKYKLKITAGLEIFGLRVYNALVENFPQTYFVGGTVRDLIINRKVGDIDIATAARPEEAVEILKKYYIDANIGYINLGVIIASNGKFACAIASLRRDIKTNSRYPEIRFVKTAREDSERRDFTINALYLSQNFGKILDFHNGLSDIKNKKIKFIGNPENKIKEDPLRIVRALRFALQLKFRPDKAAKKAMIENLGLLNSITKSKLANEINKLKTEREKKLVYSALVDKKILTNNF